MHIDSSMDIPIQEISRIGQLLADVAGLSAAVENTDLEITKG